MTLDRDEATILSNSRPAANLIVKQGPQIGILFPITGQRVILGREETCGIIIQDAEVSRRHCEVFWENDTYIVQDLGSTNGTFVNGIQVTSPVRLKPGDSIGMGQTMLVLELDLQEPSVQADYQAPISSPPSADKEEIGTSNILADNRKWFLLGCGCLILLCVCLVAGLIGLDLVDLIDLGIPGLSEFNLSF
jgi:hypothetical protein